MSDDLARRVRNLREALEAGDFDAEAYQRGLTRLRAAYSADAVDALLGAQTSPGARGHVQVISAPTDIAVAGDVHGHIFLAGQRGKTAAELLEGYLRRVARRCGILPLQGVREHKIAEDVLQISLDQVYTQLATSASAEREIYQGAALQQFDAQSFLEQHIGARLLPGQQRLGMRRPPTPDEQVQQRAHVQGVLGPNLHIDSLIAPGEIGQHLDQLNADTLSAIAQQVERLVFDGPQLIAEAIVANPRMVLLGQPGSGKSTALRYLALTLADAGLDPDVRLGERLAQSIGLPARVLPQSLRARLP